MTSSSTITAPANASLPTEVVKEAMWIKDSAIVDDIEEDASTEHR